MTKWIYETPDNGKTITRRVLGVHETDRHIQISSSEWLPLSQTIEIARQVIKEQCIRHEYPVVNELWVQYQTMLRLVSNGESK